MWTCLTCSSWVDLCITTGGSGSGSYANTRCRFCSASHPSCCAALVASLLGCENLDVHISTVPIRTNSNVQTVMIQLGYSKPNVPTQFSCYWPPGEVGNALLSGIINWNNSAVNSLFHNRNLAQINHVQNFSGYRPVCCRIKASHYVKIILKLHIYHLENVDSKVKVKTIYSTNREIKYFGTLPWKTRMPSWSILKDFQSVWRINEYELKPHLHILFHLKRLCENWNVL